MLYNETAGVVLIESSYRPTPLPHTQAHSIQQRVWHFHVTAIAFPMFWVTTHRSARSVGLSAPDNNLASHLTAKTLLMEIFFKLLFHLWKIAAYIFVLSFHGA